jgi:hypothetical protein
VTRERIKEWKTWFLTEKVCADPEIDAEKRSGGPRFQVFDRAQAGPESENRKRFAALDTGGGHDVKLRGIASLDRFLAQPKWEMSA